MTVREATLDDVPLIVEVGRVVHANSVYADIEYDDESAARTAAALIEAEDGLVMVSRSAFIMAGLVPMHFNHAIKQCIEIAFGGPGGGQLIEAAKEWARERGAVRFVAANEANEHFDGMDRIYRRYGLQPSATAYQELF